jgi:RNA polymerase sigma-70 factor (ECF subfamily)
MPLNLLPLATLERLYAQAGAERWGLALARFEDALAAAVANQTDRADQPERERIASSLHVADLALAAACIDGTEPAWRHFMMELRPAMYRAADAMDPTGNAREIADALYADLYGVTERDGVRRSLLRHYHGRSRLATWLRAVLSQRFVDRLRATRRDAPLPDDESPAPLPSAAPPPDPERERFTALVHRALGAAIAALDPRDRLRLDFYYVQQLTLAAIGRLLGEHEATVSRHLTRTRRAIRDGVERALRDEHGLDDGAIAECVRVAVQDAGTLDLAQLMGAAAAGKNAAPDRSS